MTRKIMDTITGLLVLAMLLFAFAFAGTLDYHDQHMDITQSASADRW